MKRFVLYAFEDMIEAKNFNNESDDIDKNTFDNDKSGYE